MLCESQLSKYIEWILHAGGHVQAAFGTDGGICGRYTVVYRCSEELEPEIRT